MKVSTQQPFQLIYSLFQHEYLGYLLESYIIQLDDNGQLTLAYQNISAKNAKEFDAGLNEIDYQLIELIDNIQQDVVAKKFSPRKMTVQEFFFKIYDKEKGDKNLQEQIDNYIESHKSKIFSLLEGKQLYEMSKDGYPAGQPIAIAPHKATIEFHFERTADNTVYAPIVKYESKVFNFLEKQTIIVAREPAWVLVDNVLYTFEQAVDGNKIKPFLTKKEIIIPKSKEEQYYRRFISQLVSAFDVSAEGFTIQTVEHKPVPILCMSEIKKNGHHAENYTNGHTNGHHADDTQLLIDFKFKYGNYLVNLDKADNHVEFEKQPNDVYTFYKIKRNKNIENHYLQHLSAQGLQIDRQLLLDKQEAFEWLQTHQSILNENHIAIEQVNTNYFLEKGKISLFVQENHDWFDVQATVYFGEYEIPFIQLRKHIIEKRREYILPNGKIAIIPEQWFTEYSELFALSEVDAKGEQVRINKTYVTLLQEMQDSNLAQVKMSRKLEKLRHFEQIDDVPLPKGFQGTLRPYQKAGYNWMNFLTEYKFGGCLADDMGLGKTVQTLALLQQQKEAQKGTSLLVVPTSLIYNWQKEAQKFTPELRTLNYTGTNREKLVDSLLDYDLVITSYGTVRVDVEILSRLHFNYIILDESQAIKNPTSIIAKAVLKLKTKHKLILTGTPIENSTLDLWSQMNFINAGLLGSQTFFKQEFLNPIERKNDITKIQKLHAIIKPFILRRTKSQVAKDLPEKVESIHYCQMTQEQEKYYLEAKSYYRNQILEHIEKEGVARSQLIILQGLTKLRQIANHPAMVDENYTSTSGKLEDIVYKLQGVVQEGNKVLVFSQFVKHLSIIRKELELLEIPYTYLDGSTKDRQAQVDEFQENENIQVFLISLKAGGVGLNLTAAGYVFILDPWWNPAVEEQAINRAHRIGQDKTVFIYRFIAHNTIEEKIVALQSSKKKLAEELITNDENFVKTLTQEDILELLA